MPRLHLEATEFTPADAEVITGVSVDQQRNWRRYGYLPKSLGKHARFEPHQLARMLVMQMLSKRGIGPSRSHKVASAIASRVIYRACLFSEKAFEDRSGLGLDRGFGAGFPSERNTSMMARVLSYKQHIAKHAASISPEEILKDEGNHPGLGPARYVVWYANDEIYFLRSLASADRRSPARRAWMQSRLAGDAPVRSIKVVEPYEPWEGLSGALVVLSHEAIADALLRKIDGPLFYIDVAPEDDAEKYPCEFGLSSSENDGGGDG